MRRIEVSEYDTKLCVTRGCPNEVEPGAPTEGEFAGCCYQCIDGKSVLQRMRREGLPPVGPQDSGDSAP